jgi:amidase
MPTHSAGDIPLGIQMVTCLRDDLFALDVAEKLEREIGTLLS